MNVSLVEVMRSKVVLLEEGTKIKAEPFKKFTGGPGSAGGARIPYQSSTQSVENKCTPYFSVNSPITFNTLIPDQATLDRLEVMHSFVTNYASADKLEAKLVKLLQDAKCGFQAAQEHSKSELHKWAAAEARGVQLSPGNRVSIAHHTLNLKNARFDEAAAREKLANFNRLGDPKFAANVWGAFGSFWTKNPFGQKARARRAPNVTGGADRGLRHEREADDGRRERAPGRPCRRERSPEEGGLDGGARARRATRAREGGRGA